MDEINLVPLSKDAAIDKLVSVLNNEEESEEVKNEVRESLWKRGELRWKLKGKQIDIYRHFKFNERDIVPILISRRFGKSFVMCTLAIEVCIAGPKHIVKYACPEKGMVPDIINPIIELLTEDAPTEVKPEWVPSEKKWKFPNGSFIQVAGCNGGRYNSLRGGYAQLCIGDEAAFIDELETVIFNVLAPTTDTTEGRIYLASTPNDKNAHHEYHEHFVFPFEATGELLKMTWEDSPMIDDKRREKILSRYVGGVNNQKFRCEYLCEIPHVTETTVIPEFTDKQDKIVKEVPTTDYCDFYVSMDLGFKDLTVALFGFYDFQNSRLVIQDEFCINGQDPRFKTDFLMENLWKKEKLHFVSMGVNEEPYKRVMDNNNQLLTQDLTLKGMTFTLTAKHAKDQQIDKVRRWIEKEKIIIHPRCKNLIYHIKNAQWGTNRNGILTGTFKHLKGNDKAGLLTSHADALDALIYMVRNIDTYRNPYPEHYGHDISEDTHISEKYKQKNVSEGTDFMRNLFNLKRKGKK